MHFTLSATQLCLNSAKDELGWVSSHYLDGGKKKCLCDALLKGMECRASGIAYVLNQGV
jgi:hypothetical protein